MTDEAETLENSGNQPSNKQADLDRREKLKHLLVGNPAIVRQAIHRLHVAGYAEVREWSRPISAAGNLGKSGEVVSVLIRYLPSE